METIVKSRLETASGRSMQTTRTFRVDLPKAAALVAWGGTTEGDDDDDNDCQTDGGRERGQLHLRRYYGGDGSSKASQATHLTNSGPDRQEGVCSRPERSGGGEWLQDKSCSAASQPISSPSRLAGCGSGGGRLAGRSASERRRRGMRQGQAQGKKKGEGKTGERGPPSDVGRKRVSVAPLRAGECHTSCSAVAANGDTSICGFDNPTQDGKSHRCKVSGVNEDVDFSFLGVEACVQCIHKTFVGTP